MRPEYDPGRVYQTSRRLRFRRAEQPYELHELICDASVRYAPVDEFVEWVPSWLQHEPGDFLGYTLFEDSRPDGYRVQGPGQERPRLIFMP